MKWLQWEIDERSKSSSELTSWVKTWGRSSTGQRLLQSLLVSSPETWALCCSRCKLSGHRDNQAHGFNSSWLLFPAFPSSSYQPSLSGFQAGDTSSVKCEFKPSYITGPVLQVPSGCYRERGHFSDRASSVFENGSLNLWTCSNSFLKSFLSFGGPWCHNLQSNHFPKRDGLLKLTDLHHKLFLRIMASILGSNWCLNGTPSLQWESDNTRKFWFQRYSEERRF